ncbi:MAG: hypothetical protein A2X94_02970 [Bdellovibrionales bacterium GWB1_55_8]|nr:MAG: hypothetical protein A2X94_02970 [Bdellovibrionales bacterium GWB1_55_8]
MVSRQILTIAITLAFAAPMLAKASDPAFGTLPSHYIGHGDAVYGCNRTGQCRVPTSEQLEAVIQEFITNSENRLRVLDTVLSRFEAMRDQLKHVSDEAAAAGKPRTAIYFSNVAGVVLPSLEARLPETVRAFLGPDSTLVAELKFLKDVLVTWEYRIRSEPNESIRDAFRMKLQKDYFTLTQKQSAIDRTVWDMYDVARVLETNSDDFGALEYCTQECKKALNLLPFLEFKNCAPTDVLEYAQAPFKTVFIDSKGYGDDGLSVVTDVQLITNLLDGPNGKPMTVVCKKGMPRIVKAKYKAETHSLHYPWFRGLDICFPGSCGDFNFHYSRPVISPLKWKIRDLLKRKLGN